MKLKVIYEDKDILVCLKPAGIATQTAKLASQDMVSLIKNYLVKEKGFPGDPYLGLVHRLDQPVSGLLVFAKTKAAAANLSSQLAGESAHKEYLALCMGRPGRTQDCGEGRLAKEGELVHYLKKDGKTKLAGITNRQDKEGKEARLFYYIQEEGEKFSLVKIRLKTGRFHQIRAQFSAAGHPLLGDLKYGNEESKSLSQKEGMRYVALCACSLVFTHPKTGKRMEFTVDKEDLPRWAKGQQ